MTSKTISRLIREGKYDEANDFSHSLVPVMRYVFQSRIAELTGHFEEALDLANEAQKLAKSSQEHLAVAIAQAYANWRLFQFSEGHQSLDQVNEHLEDLKFDLTPWRGTYYNIRGLLFWKDDHLDEALANFRQALVIRKEIGDQSPVSYTLNNLGNTYLKFKDHERAWEFYQDARDIRTVLQHKPALAASANSFGRLYDDLGKYNSALPEHETCLNLWQDVGNVQFIGKAYRFLAINAYYRGDTEMNNYYFDQSDAMFSDLGNNIDLQTNDSLKNKYLFK